VFGPIAPAEREQSIATGRVVKPGRTLTICELEVVAVKDGKAKPPPAISRP
jgi:hypothetical protein